MPLLFALMLTLDIFVVAVYWLTIIFVKYIEHKRKRYFNDYENSVVSAASFVVFACLPFIILLYPFFALYVFAKKRFDKSKKDINSILK